MASVEKTARRILAQVRDGGEEGCLVHEDRKLRRARDVDLHRRDVAEFNLVAWLTVGRPAQLSLRWALVVAAFSLR